MDDEPVAGALIDLDGTMYLGDRLISGADEAVTTLREHGVGVLFLSNKPIARRSDYSEKLTRLGVPTTAEEVITSSSITATYLATNHATDPVFVVGEDPLRDELRDNGISLTTDPEEAAVLLASMDRRFDYETLTNALQAMDEETAFLATNPDRTCPTETGEIPDCGAVIGAIEGVTGRDLDRVLGKPAPTAVDAATARLGVAADRCLMVGDRLETDIRMGERAGMRTVLVLSGVSDRETLEQSSVQPDNVIESIQDIETVLDA
jgi:arabinose operon protein AraL